MVLPPDIILILQNCMRSIWSGRSSSFRSERSDDSKRRRAGSLWTLPEEEDPFVISMVQWAGLILNARMQRAQLNGLVLDEKASADLTRFPGPQARTRRD